MNTEIFFNFAGMIRYNDNVGGLVQSGPVRSNQIKRRAHQITNG